MITARERYISLIEDVVLDNIYGSNHFAGGFREATKDEIDNGSYWPQRAHTMIGKKRLQNIHKCFADVVLNNIPGDLIETGVWRGGACIFMKALVDSYDQTDRKVFVADSFEGLPFPDPNYPVDKPSPFDHLRKHLVISKEEVENNFKKYNLLDDRVVFIKGWFEHSLSNPNIKQLAILRLDGDMYSSTIQAIEQLYDKLSVGGYVIVDDYGLDECKKAIIDFRNKRNITTPIIPIDWVGAYWKKEK